MVLLFSVYVIPAEAKRRAGIQRRPLNLLDSRLRRNDGLLNYYLVCLFAGLINNLLKEFLCLNQKTFT